MSGGVRMMANGIPGFQSDGFSVGATWVGVAVGELSPKARAALVKYTGRFARVHPEDASKLAEHGLELYKAEDGVERVREIEKPKASTSTDGKPPKK